MKTVRLSLRTCIALIAAVVALWMIFRYMKRNSTHVHVHLASSSSLTTDGRHFRLDGKPFRILSGAIHYFRVLPEYWEDRLWKLKAMGLNTVETYVAWNIHEQEPGRFDFKTGMRDITKFIRTAQSLGLHVVIRPGPYICAEWDMGGLPAWLLRDPDMKLRTLYRGFTEAVDRYFDHLIPLFVPLQRVNGGPVIAVQVENEYGSYGEDNAYMMYVKDALVSRGIEEMLFTSDGGGVKPWGELLQTVNFQKNMSNIDKLLKVQPNKPVTVMEFWSGWFDHWGEKHSVLTVSKALERIGHILSVGGSINLYMFHGGTNFGFMNGANDGKYHNLTYSPTVTSYDYDSPLSEAGDVTEKYVKLRKLILNHEPTLSLPETPNFVQKMAYKPVKMDQHVELIDIAKLTVATIRDKPISMERLPIHNSAGQAYGFTLYETNVAEKGRKLKISGVKDRGIILVDGVPVATAELGKHTTEIDLVLSSHSTGFQLSVLVENCGRVNFGRPPWFESKGLVGEVFVDEKKLTQWSIFPLEFDSQFLEMIAMKSDVWKVTPAPKNSGPIMYTGTLTIPSNIKPKDTFINLQVFSLYG